MRPKTLPFAMPPVLRTAWLLCLSIAGPACAAGGRTPVTICGSGFTFQVSAPAGWTLDGRSGADQGAHAVLYPKGESWDGAAAAMYVSSATREAGRTLESYMASELAEFKQEVGGHVQVAPMPALTIASGAQVPVRSFAGDQWRNHEAVAYVESPGHFVLLTLTARRADTFDAALPAFRRLVASWRFVSSDEEEVFRVASAYAHSMLDQPDGARYDAEFGSAFGRLLVGAMESCTRHAPPSDLAAFDVVARVSADGEPEDVLVWPRTAVAACLRAEMQKTHFPPPPGPGWWVRTHMDIRP